MTKRILFFLILSTALGLSAIGQSIYVHPEFDPSWFGQGFALSSDTKFCPIDGSTNTTYQYVTMQATNGGGTIDNFVFGADNPNNDCNRWFNIGVVLNTPTTFAWGGMGCPSVSDSKLATTTFTAGRYYTFRIKHNGYNDMQGIVMETANQPVTFTNVSAIDNLVYGCLSAAPSIGEKVFVRYRILPAGTWQTVEATMGNGAVSTGNSSTACFNAIIPGSSGQDFEFYALTSTAPDATELQANPDIYTLRDYGTDSNGQSGNSTCPKLSNLLTRTIVDNHCVSKGGAVITMDGAVDVAQYQYITEADHGAPLLPKSDDLSAIANSDFPGESSANIVSYDADVFNYANFNNIQVQGWGTADIKKFHVSWDATYLYFVVEGPSADKYFGAGSLDRMDLFIAIDKDNSVASNPYNNTHSLPASAAPWNKRVDFNGWIPDYFVAIDRIGPNPSAIGQGKNLAAGFHDGSDHGDYAALFAAGNAMPLAEERDMGVLGACPSFDVSANVADLSNGIHEVRVPWASIGGIPDIFSGQKMNFSIYTTYDEIGFDTYDTGPGLAQGHGKPFEQIGDTPWDGDHWGGYNDPVTNTNDYTAQNNFGEALNADPSYPQVRDNGMGDNTANGRQPGSDDANTNGAAAGDFDTVEEYYTVGNVGQIASKVECSTLPDGSATASALCTTAVPPARTGTFTETTLNTNPVINNSSYVANGGVLTVTDAGGCYAESIVIAANNVQSNSLAGPCVNCPANSYGTTERTYTITDNSRPSTLPIVDCTTPTYGANLSSCTVQTFTRTAVNVSTPTLNVQNINICAGASADLTTAITLNTGNAPKFYSTQALADAGGVGDISNTVSPAITTTYYVRVESTELISCYTVAAITVNVTALPSNLSVIGDCGPNPTDGSATLTVSANGTNLEYALNGGTYQTSNIFSNVFNGDVTISVRVQSTICTSNTSIVVNCVPFCTPNAGMW